MLTECRQQSTNMAAHEKAGQKPRSPLSDRGLA
ncbi:hypothetical protein ATCR1_11548 [Agrobacterium tumefaciens CCNWGS0286]|jgi:hypothetical protein|nr:hypothetical protein ATCR1_11548 [Agrobacterium tumefaciens CCNWGS0286]